MYRSTALRLLALALHAVILLSLQNALSAQSDLQASGGSLIDPTAKYVPNRILVKFRSGTVTAARQTVHSLMGTRILKQFGLIRNLEAVGLPDGLSVRDAVRIYRQRPEVEYAEPDYIVHALATPNDLMFPQMWNLLNTGQSGGSAGADIKASSAWNLTTGSHSVIVAILDSGIDYNHADLTANLFRNTADCNNNGVDDDGNGFVDDCYGISPARSNSDPLDDNGHGTHVAGIIGAAGNNGLGVVGVIWNVQLMACKFLDVNGFGDTEGAVTCLDYVQAMKNRGYNIVATNNSWGGGPYSQALVDAIQAQQQAGILFVVAAGNDFGDNDAVPTYPADTFLPNVISVAATTRTDGLATFSNVGQRTVHLV